MNARRTTTTRRLGFAVGMAALGFAMAGCNTRFGATLDRHADPIVLEGSSLPKLIGASPRHVVGFSWDGSSWHQIPVQVDERDRVSPGAIYHMNPAAYPVLYGTSTPFEIEVYTPPIETTSTYRSDPTYTPVDSNPNVDGDDEVAFMASDTGTKATAATGAPIGVTASSWQEVEAVNPLDPSQIGYVYLFESNTLTGGSGGTTGVGYDFELVGGPYTEAYHIANWALPPNDSWTFNPESSQVTTPGYALGFSDRWLNDSLMITRPGSNGSQVLDRSKYYATTAAASGGTCTRNEDTFDGADTGEGAFIVNLAGPVRAIRSSMGANSFKYTTTTDVFYPYRQDTTIELRGHAGMPGFGQGDDLSTGLVGMTYSDPANSGLVIDGNPDAFVPITSKAGDPTQPDRWQLIAGPSGSMVTIRTLETSIADLDVSTSYFDETPATVTPCTGDGSYWGQAGFATVSPTLNVPVTDPTLSADAATYTARRFRYYDTPALTAQDAAILEDRVDHPITTSVRGTVAPGG